MLKQILLIIIIPFIVFSFERNPDSEKTYNLQVTQEKVKVDGIIDFVWSQTDSVSDFIMFQPYNGSNPTQKTVAKIFANNDALYVLMVMYDNTGKIQANAGTQDQFTGDVVSIMLDTFGDNRTAYKFAVSASGVKSDARLLDDGRNRDYSWDGIWFAASRIYPWGYVVEMEIPFKSLQYNPDISSWGLDLDRWIPENFEDIYWCDYNKNEGLRISRFGRLFLGNFRPGSEGLNLEIYPVGIIKTEKQENGTYNLSPNAGIDLFYNPSPNFTLMMTSNPDFAQIEADPYDFNISRYESYFKERRPFFTEGNEIFLPSGKQRNTGFYQPLELFYSRRIGKKLPNGNEVPIYFGSKAFGRLDDWEYGGFVAFTGDEEFFDDNGKHIIEEKAQFAAIRMKKQIFENSQIGFLFVGKKSGDNFQGVFDVDGAFRSSDYQFTYQVAGANDNGKTDMAFSGGLIGFTKNYNLMVRTRHVGKEFNISQTGFVPWRGTTEITFIAGPTWYPDSGSISQIFIYTGASLDYEAADKYWDRILVFGYNMNFRNNLGFEVTYFPGKSKDNSVMFNAYEVDISAWYNNSLWNLNLYGGYAKTYNFSRDFLAPYAWSGLSINYQAMTTINIGTSFNAYFEGNPQGSTEDYILNARPFISVTPINYLNIRIYIDNLYTKTSGKIDRIILGGLFSWNFAPKSWLYFAYNEFQERDPLANAFEIIERAAVLKLKYLYYL
ncbi:MAG: carbohydrate binding family 9 domain-containing protein [Ignavibacteriales bacterium]|nr:carbohydrate binding family 9 domain-containing protein [Ignavibacteriales bacterium]